MAGTGTAEAGTGAQPAAGTSTGGGGGAGSAASGGGGGGGGGGATGSAGSGAGGGSGAGTGNGSSSSSDDDGLPADLGEAGRRAIRAEREARAKAERERDAAAAERDRLKEQTQTAEEKAITAAKKEGAQEATLAANRRIVKSEIRAASAGKVADPEDVAALLGDLDRFVVKDEVDSKAITEAISELVKAKPYLAAPGKAKPLPGGGATQSSGVSMNDDIRRRLRRG